MKNKTIEGHALTVLQGLDAEAVQCIITSPPFFGLRNYGMPAMEWPALDYSILGLPVHVPAQKACLGLEKDRFHFIGHLILIFREAHRCLKNNGTMFVNMGDSYAGYHGNSKKQDSVTPSDRNCYTENMRASTVDNNRNSTLSGSKSRQNHHLRSRENVTSRGLKAKDLIGVPWMLAFALRDDGWYLRQDIIWHKPNPMPESVIDRCVKAHEYVFLLSKSAKYYFDYKSIRTPVVLSSKKRLSQNIEGQTGSSRAVGKTNGNMKAVAAGQANLRAFREEQRTRKSGNLARKDRPDAPNDNGKHQSGSVPFDGLMANKRSVWTVPTKPLKENHFAVFPDTLITDMVKAGTRVGDTVLDMFNGSGTTGRVARALSRNSIGIELNPEYIGIDEKLMFERFANRIDMGI